MSIIMIYLWKSNGKENGLKSRFCLSCKNDEMSLRPFWHNTVDIWTGKVKTSGTEQVAEQLLHDILAEVTRFVGIMRKINDK